MEILKAQTNIFCAVYRKDRGKESSFINHEPLPFFFIFLVSLFNVKRRRRSSKIWRQKAGSVGCYRGSTCTETWQDPSRSWKMGSNSSSCFATHFLFCFVLLREVHSFFTRMSQRLGAFPLDMEKMKQTQQQQKKNVHHHFSLLGGELNAFFNNRPISLNERRKNSGVLK